jgi:hypothetical protein
LSIAINNSPRKRTIARWRIEIAWIIAVENNFYKGKKDDLIPFRRNLA